MLTVSFQVSSRNFATSQIDTVSDLFKGQSQIEGLRDRERFKEQDKFPIRGLS